MKFLVLRRSMTLIAGALAITMAAHAQTFSVLHTFHNATDGASPYAGLILDAAGNLYGTTPFGGAHNFGTVYKVASLTMGGTERVLYSFMGGADGGRPYGTLVRDPYGNLYGTTLDGGDLSCRPPHGVELCSGWILRAMKLSYTRLLEARTVRNHMQV